MDTIWTDIYLFVTTQKNVLEVYLFICGLFNNAVSRSYLYIEW
jgi:hypothetical protein